MVAIAEIEVGLSIQQFQAGPGAISMDKISKDLIVSAQPSKVSPDMIRWRGFTAIDQYLNEAHRVVGTGAIFYCYDPTPVAPEKMRSAHQFGLRIEVVPDHPENPAVVRKTS